ncbi:MAG: hypothetical protein NVSMB32_17210 [Actinomycetota bacterium]
MADLEEVLETASHGEGPVGVASPGDPGTLEKGEEADEQSPKAVGYEAVAGQDAATLGVLTEGDRGV